MSGTILVVDDDAKMVSFIEHFLTKAGYTVAKATNGDEAYRVVSTNHVDLVISDIVMSGVGGVELTLKLRTAAPKLSIILMSGLADMKSDAFLRLMGQLKVNRLLEKPFSRETLLQAVNDELSASPSPV